ncbi:cell envelope integrity protein TolA [Vibrio harveyi]|uniref:cell envelope integrity protein TolA n=1 Tax=Vibrio harveyi TaxID=669 RepID=UPI003BB7F365
MKGRVTLIVTLTIIFGNAEARERNLMELMEVKEGDIVGETISAISDRINSEFNKLRPFKNEQKCSLNIKLDKWGKITGVKPLKKNDFCFSLVGNIWKIDEFHIPLNAEVYKSVKDFNIYVND